MTNPYGRPDLAPGDEGEWVTDLQERLQTLGVYLGSCDGRLGERTVAAIHEFTLVYHVSADPAVLVGEPIWAALLAQGGPGAGGVDGIGHDGTGQHPTQGQLSDDRAWVWRDGSSWQPAPPPDGTQPQADGTQAQAATSEPVSEDGHWRWVDNQWQPNR